MPDTVDTDAIAAAERLIRPYVRRTPVIGVDPADFDLDARSLALKLECLQHSGSFKARGAFDDLLMRDVPPAGVVAASGGNHAVAVGFAAMKLRIPARVYVPQIASPAKLALIRRYGAELVVGGELYADALAESDRWAAESGALRLHAYDQRETLLGQGTVGLEMEEQSPALRTLLVAVGGGGLIGGIAARTRGGARRRRRAGEGADPRERAPCRRARGDSEAGGVAADSLAPRRVGARCFPSPGRG